MVCLDRGSVDQDVYDGSVSIWCLMANKWLTECLVNNSTSTTLIETSHDDGSFVIKVPEHLKTDLLC